MQSDKKLTYFLMSLLFVIVSLSLFIPFEYRRIVAAVSLSLLALLIFFVIKKRSLLSIYKWQVTLLMFIIGLLYLMIYYLPGIEYGFYRNLYATDKMAIFKYILPISVIIIAIEVIRRIMLAQNDKVINVILFISAVFADILVFASHQKISSLEGLMDILSFALFPAITFNVLYTFISKRFGMMPNIVFRFIITLYLYIIRVVPKTPDVLVAFAQLIVPLLIMLFVKMLYEKQKKVVSHTSKKVTFITSFVTLLIMVSIVMLISCQFRFGILVIASESMTGEIDKGDAVLYERYDEQIITEGDIIVFKVNNSLVVHRVVRVENINNVNRYYTQGDANDYVDQGYRTDSAVVGIAQFKIKYIGYPSIWVRDIFD